MYGQVSDGWVGLLSEYCIKGASFIALIRQMFVVVVVVVVDDEIIRCHCRHNHHHHHRQMSTKTADKISMAKTFFVVIVPSVLLLAS